MPSAPGSATRPSLELEDLVPEGGRVVLRYRYHPAWKGPPGLRIERHPVPEDPAGFLSLIDPPREAVLRFDPRAMLSAPWPESVARPVSDKERRRGTPAPAPEDP